MNKTIIWSVFLGTMLISCLGDRNKGIPVVNLEALHAVPLDHSIDKLAMDTTFIDVTLPPNARIDELSQEELGLLKAAAYRFYQHVRLENNQYRVDLKDPKVLHISEPVIKAYEQAISSTNHFADSMAKTGQVIQLPPVSEEYLKNLLK